MVDNRVSPPRIDEDARVERQNSLSLLELCTVPTGTGHYIPISHKIAPAVLAAIQFATIDENGSQHVRVGLSALVTLFCALQIFWEWTGSLPCAAIRSYIVCLCTSYNLFWFTRTLIFFYLFKIILSKGKKWFEEVRGKSFTDEWLWSMVRVRWNKICGHVGIMVGFNGNWGFW